MKNVEISLKELLLAVLYHWKFILVCMIGLGLLMGAFGYFIEVPTKRRAQSAYEANLKLLEEDSDKARLAFDPAVQSLFLQRKSLQNEIAKKELERENYGFVKDATGQLIEPLTIDESHYLVSEAFGIYSFTVDREILKEFAERQPGIKVVERIVHSVFQTLEADDLYSIFNEAFPEHNDIDPYDIVKFARDDAGAYITITVTVNKSSGVNASKVLAVMQQTLYSTWFNFQNYPVENSFVTLGTRSRDFKDYKGMESAKASFLLLNEEIISMEQTRNEIDRKIGDSLKKPNDIIGAGMLAVYGMLIGFAVSFLLVLLAQLSRLTLRHPEQMANLTGLRYLGGQRDGKFRLTRLAGGERGMLSRLEFLPLVSSNVSRMVQPGHTVLLTGSLPEDRLVELADGLNEYSDKDDITFIAGTDVTHSADTVRKLPQADSVLLVESLNKSRSKNILMQKDRLGIAEKSILGYILI